jgi:CDP-glucose 4,6-dehydratase
MKDLFEGAFSGRTVLVTGHTGFVGSWLILWLEAMGAEVVGYSLEPPTDPSLFEILGLAERVNHIHGDVRDIDRLKEALSQHHPEMVFHLAAQSLVRFSYDHPVETYGTNVMGTVNLLEAVRTAPEIRVCVVVTTDKCYENRETGHLFREDDPLGGYDPYSSSKACAELVTGAYRRSFFSGSAAGEGTVALSSVRAGNIIGGGDWAEDRLIPDCVRALNQGRDITIRNPKSIRPWQYVLEPVAGYLWLAALMWRDPSSFSEAWNFGPPESDCVTVGELTDMLLRFWGGRSWSAAERGKADPEKHEAGSLKLDCSKAMTGLKWQPVYPLIKAVEQTVQWYREYGHDPDGDLYRYTLNQISEYVEDARKAEAVWTLRGK